MKEHRQNRHHLIGKSLKNEYNVHEDCNKITMDEHRHNALHALFGLLLTPKEQQMELSCIFDTVVSDKVKEIYAILNTMSDQEFYNTKVLKKKSLLYNI